MRGKRGAVFAGDLQDELGVLQGDSQSIGTGVAARQGEAVFIDQIVDRDLTLVLLVSRAAADRGLVEAHGNAAIALGWGAAAHDVRWSIRSATERACASNPSARPSVIAAGPSVSRLAAPHFRIVVLFRKSRTLRPEENRAERAVGSTWFEPPT